MSGTTAVSTSFLSLPGEPQNMKVLNQTGGAITLAWQPPLDDGGSEVTKYDVYFFIGFEVKQQFHQSVHDVSRTTMSITAKVVGLSANTAYGFVVAAVNEISACADFSRYAGYTVAYGTTTSASTPDSPRNFTIATSTTGMQKLVWLASEDTGGAGFVGYIVYSDNWSVLYNGTQTSFQRGGLAPNTSYGYRVVAWNSAGSSPASGLVAAHTTGSFTVPGVPTNLEMVSATGGSIELQWSAPIDTGGDVLSSYHVFRNGTLVTYEDSASAVVTLVDDRNLYADQAYAYYIRATNSMGASQPNMLLVARTTSASRPRPPTQLDVFANGGRLNASWTPAGDTGGISLAAYRFRINSSMNILVEALTPATNFTYYGIEAMTTYNVSMVAINAIDESLAFVKSVTNGNATWPEPPNAPTVVSTGSQSVILQLSIPRDTGGSPISELRLYQDGVLRQVVQTNRSIQIEVTGLQAQKTYRFRVSAVSLAALGESTLSDTTAVVTGNPTIPTVVYSAVLVQRTSSSLEVKWAGPDNTGGEGVTFEVLYTTQGSGINASVSFAIQRVDITGLNASTTYAILVRAKNSAGAGPWMSEFLVVATDVAQRGVVVFEKPVLSIDENAGTAVINLVRVNGSSSTIQCNYALLNTSNATEGTDFVLAADTNRSFVFLEGETAKSFEITIVDNAVYDPLPRLLNVVLVDTTDRSDVVEPQLLTVSIDDDGDAGTIAFESAIATIPENGGCINLPISRTNGASTETTVSITAIDDLNTTAREGVDFQLVASDIVFPDQVTAANVSVCVVDNSVFDFPYLVFQLALHVVAGGGRIDVTNVTRVVTEDDGDTSPPGMVGLISVSKATGGMLRFAWTPPVNLGGQSLWVLRYNISFSTINSSDTRVITTRDNATEISVGGLATLTRYFVHVAAINAVGVGQFSGALNHSTTNFTAPGPVTEISLIKRTGGLLTINIMAPMDIGGTVISRYEIVISHSSTDFNQVRPLSSSCWC